MYKVIKAVLAVFYVVWEEIIIDTQMIASRAGKVMSVRLVEFFLPIAVELKTQSESMRKTWLRISSSFEFFEVVFYGGRILILLLNTSRIGDNSLSERTESYWFQVFRSGDLFLFFFYYKQRSVWSLFLDGEPLRRTTAKLVES